MVRRHCRAHSRQSYRWYVNGKLYKQVLAPGRTPNLVEAAATKVLSSPYTVSLDYLCWPIQFESKEPRRRNDVIVAIDAPSWGSAVTARLAYRGTCLNQASADQPSPHGGVCGRS
jgi:hypothetical protein